MPEGSRSVEIYPYIPEHMKVQNLVGGHKEDCEMVVRHHQEKISDETPFDRLIQRNADTVKALVSFELNPISAGLQLWINMHRFNNRMLGLMN